MAGNVHGDIRQVRPEDYAEELRARWGALLSYRYIGRAFAGMNTTAVDETVALRHDMRNAAGGVLAAPLAITCPAAGGRSDLQTVPNPVVHSLQVLDDARGVRRIEVVDVVSLKTGRTMEFGRARIVDADDHDRVIALVESQGASIGEVPEGLQRFDDDAVMHVEDSPDLPPLWQVFGASRRADGHWQLPHLRGELASPDAALHIGPQHVVLETAAIEAASAVVGTDRLQVTSAHVMFLARGKEGPFRADARAVRGAGDGGPVGVQLTLVDEGSAGRAVTAASYAFQVV
ncbi:hypothetical protein [Blastococcus sp. TF02A-26]|uniref:hypothetical protein n=1 Tax=Blastococcus sp. TF02A-26 TaxID=2250577 RepID=UPI000DEB0FC0|nr:hypothetical protein [Blastococcus sp. TF02A-26]RBY84702.1 hypothetical protein DQ240_13750 [Blastococcus sp. TF02A-26]